LLPRLRGRARERGGGREHADRRGVRATGALRSISRPEGVVAMFDVLLEATLRATLIAAAAPLVLWLLRVRAAAVRHRVWTVVLLAMLALPVWIAYGPEIALHMLPPTYSSPSAGAPLPGIDAPIGETAAAMPSAARSVVAGSEAKLTAAPSA